MSDILLYKKYRKLTIKEITKNSYKGSYNGPYGTKDFIKRVAGELHNIAINHLYFPFISGIYKDRYFK